MKSILLFNLLIPTLLQSQDVNFKWAKQIGNGDMDVSTAMAVDKLGNVYTTGYFEGTVDFDPGPGVYNLSRPYAGYEDFGYEDMFVCKLDAAGNFIWAKQIAAHEDYDGTEVLSIVLDTAGNIYTAGFFYGTVDFDPGPCVYNLTSAGWGNAFILKLNADGDFIWVKQMIADTNSDCWANFIALDELGNIYTTGYFEGIVDFDPGPGVYNLNAFNQDHSYNQSMYVSKLDNDGNFIWAKQMKGSCETCTAVAVGTSLSFDVSGNNYTTGRFYGIVDFDPGPGTYNLTSPWNDNFFNDNAFILKLDVNGNFIWAKQITGNGTSESWAKSIKIDKSGNIITSGGFWGTNDFDPGAGVFNLTSTFNGMFNMFISKLDSGGNFIWAKGIGSTRVNNHPSSGPDGGVGCTSMVLDSSDNIYTAGYFQDTVDFDPGAGVFNLTSAPDLPGISSGEDMFISKLDDNGNFVWAKQMRTTLLTYWWTHCSSLEVDDYGNIYTSGDFIGATDFDPGPDTFNLSSSSQDRPDIFICKMTPCTGSTSANITVTSCKSYSLNGHTYSESGVFIQTILNKSGCDSIITLNLTINRVDTIINIAACNSYTHCRTYNNCTVCYTFDSSGVYTDTLTSANGCDSVVHMNITIGSIRTSFYDTACNTYSWNGQTFTSSGSYIDTLVASNGCDSIVTLNLIINNVAVSAQPQSVNLCAGSNNTFSVTATGTNISYQWQLSTDGGFTFTDIAGANSSSYILSSVTTAQNGYQFRCIVMGLCDTIISSNAVLSVAGAVAIIADPADAEVCSGSNTSFLVTATNVSSVSYQWEVSTNSGITYLRIVNGGVYSGSTNSVLSITNADESLTNNRYRCILSNSSCGGSMISNSAVLIVRRAPTVQLTASPFTSLFPWQTTTLTATPVAPSGQLLPLTWYYNNVVASASNNSRIVSFNQAGAYQVQVSERWPSDLVCLGMSTIVTINASTERKLIIYPNPNHGQFRISYYNPSGVSDLQVVTIYDSKGAMVYRARFTLTGIYTSIDIRRLSLSAGFYSVAVADTNGKRLTVGKIIVD